MGEIKIREWEENDQQKVIDLILSIQRGEFGIAVTAEDQPDLEKVYKYYQKGNGNFWVAEKGNNIIGTIALIEFEDQQVALRKMFVHKDLRGKEIGVAQQLLDHVKRWCKERNVTDIYLGTVEVLKAAQRFYEKNGFVQVQKDLLPSAFPLMKVDTIFYHYQL